MPKMVSQHRYGLQIPLRKGLTGKFLSVKDLWAGIGGGRQGFQRTEAAIGNAPTGRIVGSCHEGCERGHECA